MDVVQSCFPAGTPADAGSLLTNARQESAVRRSLEAVRRALSALDSGLTPDTVLTDAEEALESIGELTGRTAKARCSAVSAWENNNFRFPLSFFLFSLTHNPVYKTTKM